jgi:hypothetical protein
MNLCSKFNSLRKLSSLEIYASSNGFPLLLSYWPSRYLIIDVTFNEIMLYFSGYVLTTQLIFFSALCKVIARNNAVQVLIYFSVFQCPELRCFCPHKTDPKGLFVFSCF